MYTLIFSDEFKEQLRKLSKKDSLLKERVMKKVLEISENPEHHKPLKYCLKGKRRAHVGSFVILFEIKEENVEIITIVHHDFAYN